MFLTYLTWFKAHERFLVIVLAAVLVIHLWGSALQAWVTHDKQQASLATEANRQAQSQLEVQTKSTLALNARIDDLMRQRAVDTGKQKQIDNAAKASEVASRIVDLLKIKPEEVTVSPADNTLVLSNQAAHEDVNALEDLQQSRADVLDLSTKLGACTALSDQKDTVLGTEKKAHIDDVNLEKDKTKKAFWHGFKWGVVTGFVGGIVTHF